MSTERQSTKPPLDIHERAFKFSLRAVKLHQFLQGRRDRAGWRIGDQFLNSETSIGANLEEAQSGESRADFVHKVGIAQKEARECLYWLRLLAESGLVPKERLGDLLGESDQLIAILTAILVNTKRKPTR